MHFDPAAFLADPDLLKGLESCSSPIPCAEEFALFRQGDPPTGLFILVSGNATLSMTSPAGKRIISFSAAPGSLLGLPGLISNEPYSLTAIAHVDACVSFIPREQFLALMRTDMQLSMKVLQVLAAEVRSARDALRDR